MALSKIEARETGRANGRSWAEAATIDSIRVFYSDDYAEAFASTLHQIASKNAINLGLRVGSVNYGEYIEGFQAVARSRTYNRYSELPDVKAMFADRGYRSMLDSMINDANADLAKFQKRFTDEPAYAFEWATEAFQAAANLKQAKIAKMLLEGDAIRAAMGVVEVKAKFLQDFRYNVRLEGSTSPASNLMEQATAIAKMRLAGLR